MQESYIYTTLPDLMFGATIAYLEMPSWSGGTEHVKRYEWRVRIVYVCDTDALSHAFGKSKVEHLAPDMVVLEQRCLHYAGIDIEERWRWLPIEVVASWQEAIKELHWSVVALCKEVAELLASRVREAHLITSCTEMAQYDQ